MARKWSSVLALSAVLLRLPPQWRWPRRTSCPPSATPTIWHTRRPCGNRWRGNANRMTTPVYKGASPHGAYLRMFSSYVTVGGVARPIVVKENFGGPDVTAETATAKPDEWLRAVTIMLQREAGYDDDNDNWFWVEFAPDGSVMSNPKGMKLSGRVAKGMPAGCISCHLSADDGDYLFFND